MPSSSALPSREHGTVWPPPLPDNETLDEQLARLAKETEAKRVSDAIDNALEAERQEKRSKRRGIKILLLGQSESGKSTTLKNFQLQFTPRAFHAEAESWRTVIHLNLIRSVLFILSQLSDPRASASTPIPSPSPLGTHFDASSSYAPASMRVPIPLTDDLRHLKLRLQPLKHVEHQLSKRLAGEEQLEEPQTGGERGFEVAVRSGSGWKGLLRGRGRSSMDKERVTRASISHGHGNDLSEARQVLEACREDMCALWADLGVQSSLKNARIVLQDEAGFFLDDIERITSGEYEPTPEDILRARLQTMGVEEHRLLIESERLKGQEWVIYDCGGSRSQRAAWAPYFDDVNSIIFLAPLSAFDQYLSEDRSVNRLEDSLTLWKQTCSNRLLAPIEIVLFLNKCDILAAKISAGAQFGEWVTSYGDRPNEYESIAQYIRAKFVAVHKQHSPRARKLHCHMTSVTNPKATSTVLDHVRQIVVIENLEKSDFL